MDKPAVFTPDEIARFQAELASRREPGAYRPGHWSTSPLNRRADVIGTFPERVRLRDATLRSIETMPGVVATEEAKQDYLRRLVRAGVGEVVTAGARGRSDAELAAEVTLIKEGNPDCLATCPLVFTPEAIDTAARAGYDTVQIWVPPFGEASLVYARIYPQAWRGEQWRTEQTPRSRAAVLATAARLIEHARGRGLRVSAPMLMVSYLTDEMLVESVEVLGAAGVSEITLFDGPGAMSPEAYAHLVTRTRELAVQRGLDLEIGLHPHNTFGLAVGCAVAAARAGANAIELSVNGYCGGPGNADLAATAVAFEALYGVNTGIVLDELTDLARAGEELTGYRVAWNHPMTGHNAFCWGGMDLITQEIVVDPLLHNCVEPAIVGNRRRVPLTLDSGGYTMAENLERIGVPVASVADVDRVLAACHRTMTEEQRLLDDDDIRAIAEKVLSA